MKNGIRLCRLLAVITAITMLASCAISDANTEASLGELQSSSSVSPQLEAEHEAAQPLSPQDTLIENPELLNELWNTYIMPAELELDDFKSTEELTPYQTTRVAFAKFIAGRNIGILEKAKAADGESFLKEYIWPLAEAEKQVELLFNIDIADAQEYFSRIEANNYYGPEYSAEHGAILFRSEASSDERWSGENIYPYGENPWGFGLGRVWQTPEGINAELNNFYDLGSDIISHTLTITLKRREDASLYFVSAENKYYNNNIADMSGSFRQLNCLDDELGYMVGGSQMIGDEDGSIFIYRGEGASYENENAGRVRIWKIDTVKDEIAAGIDQRVEVDLQSEMQPNARNTGDGFLVMDKSNVYKYDYSLELTGIFKIPEAVSKRFFREYDVSADGLNYYFNDNEGLWRYSVAEDEYTLLVASEIGTGRLMEGAVIAPSHFKLVDGDRKLIYTIFGYEGIAGQYCINLKTGEISDMPSAYYGSFTGTQYGSGHMAVDAYSEPLTVRYFDFANEQMSETVLPAGDKLNNPQISFQIHSVSPVGKSHGLIGIVTSEGALLYRAKLPGLQIEQMDFDIKTWYEPMGIMADGTAVIHYHVNNAEQGIVLIG